MDRRDTFEALRRSVSLWWRNPILVGAIALVVGVVGGALASYRFARTGSPAGAEVAAHDGHDHEGEGHGEEDVVTYPRAKWPAAGLTLATVKRDDFPVLRWITGKLALNQDRLAHISPLVEGIVREVLVEFGERVERGQVLATIDSKEVGDAKLQLVQSRLNLRIAQVEYDWDSTVYQNVKQLIDAIRRGVSMDEIENRFRGMQIGNYRSQLISAYARLYQAQADYQRLQALTRKGITREADLIRARSEFEAARATLSAWVEQIEFAAMQQQLRAQMKVEEADTQKRVAESSLYILGYSREEVAQMEPLTEYQRIGVYPVRAAFSGTIISKDAMVGERVGPGKQMFTLADLSSLWVQADIYERDIALIQDYTGKEIRFRTQAFPGEIFRATVFYTGDIVDPDTRTVRMLAHVQNPDRRLKPGLFVEVALERIFPNVLQVPASAVTEHEGETFVFVYTGDDRFEKRAVRVGRKTEEVVEILEGLEPGEQVAAGGVLALKTELVGVEAEHGH